MMIKHITIVDHIDTPYLYSLNIWTINYNVLECSTYPVTVKAKDSFGHALDSIFQLLCMISNPQYSRHGQLFFQDISKHEVQI